MRLFKIVPVLASVFALTACPSSSDGEGLCLAANVESECGISPAACLEALRADEEFRIDNVFTAWAVTLDDDGTRCILNARDLGATNVAIDLGGGGDPKDISIDVGEARAPGRLLQQDPPA